MNGYNPPDPKDRKKFMFYDTAERQTDLKVRLHYDGLNQSQFFRLMITGYLEQDENVMAFVHACKNKLKIHNAKKRKQSEKEYSGRQDTIRDFALEEEDIENIYDIMEGDV